MNRIVITDPAKQDLLDISRFIGGGLACSWYGEILAGCRAKHSERISVNLCHNLRKNAGRPYSAQKRSTGFDHTTPAAIGRMGLILVKECDRLFSVIDAIGCQLRETGFLRYPLIFSQGSKRNPVSGPWGGCDRQFSFGWGCGTAI